MPPIDRGLGDTLGSAPRISTRCGLSGVWRRKRKKKLQTEAISQSLLLLLLPQQRVAICSTSPLMPAAGPQATAGVGDIVAPQPAASSTRLCLSGGEEAAPHRRRARGVRGLSSSSCGRNYSRTAGGGSRQVSCRRSSGVS